MILEERSLSSQALSAPGQPHLAIAAVRYPCLNNSDQPIGGTEA
jgi:hypothetical protein